MPADHLANDDGPNASTTVHSATASTDGTFYAPSIAASRRSSTRIQNSSLPFLNPPPLPTDDAQADDEDDEDTQGRPLGPHDLTPSLHASLVSEILALRREVDSKNNFIDQLESTLDEAKVENESLQQNLARNNKETRAVKRQLKTIEDSTLSALEQLYKERDQANESALDFKARLDGTQKRLKSEQDKAERAQVQLDQEKSQWMTSKSQLERRAHTAESRLKAVVAEVAAREAAVVRQLEQQQQKHVQAEGGTQDEKAPYEHASPFSSPEKVLKRHTRQKDSVGSINPDVHVTNLADELDDDDADDLNTDEEAAILEDEDLVNHESRVKKVRESRQNSLQDSKARKILGMLPDDEAGIVASPTSPTATSPTINQQEPRHDVSTTEPSTPKAATRDVSSMDRPDRPQMHERMDSVSTATMYSPPETPTQLSHWNRDSIVESPKLVQPTAEVEANQRRKRDPLRIYVEDRPQSQSHSRTRSEPSPWRPSQQVEPASTRVSFAQQKDWDSGPMSAASQDSFVTASGQKLPVPVSSDKPAVPALPPQFQPQMVSSSTQTEAPTPPPPSYPPPAPPSELKSVEEPPAPTRAPPLPPLSPASSAPPPPMSEDPAQHVPSITIHPPTSRPSSPLPTVLPPGTKSASCQADLPMPSLTPKMASKGVQTNVTRVNSRPIRVPPHLLPLLRSREKSREANKNIRLAEDESAFELEPSPYFVTETYTDRKSTLSASKKHDSKSNATEVEGEDESWSRIRKTLTQSSRTRNLQDITLGEDDEEEDLSDEELLARLQSYRASKSAHRGARSTFDPPTPVPENEKVNTVSSHRLQNSLGSKSSWERLPQPYNSRNVSSKSSRRSSQLDSTGQVSIPRTRSPSATSAGSSSAWSRSATYSHFPPFAIPKRRSSARVTQSKHHKATSRSGESSPSRRKDTKSKRPASLRKSKSALAILNNSRKSDSLGSIPLTPVSASSLVSDESRPPVPPISSNFKAMFTGRNMHNRDPSSLSHRYSTTIVPTGNASSVGNRVQHLTVVDTVASTMVGEWMWKYVRKRKSFGKGSSGDPLQDPGKSGDTRHKRWVWLSPHDRTVMWSNKQPTSGSALMGKAGRKLIIQSVLDVSDESPLPKGADPKTVFNRSILVLTPDRALKFTAMSLEAHYMWLTALSFLGNNTSQQQTLDLSMLPRGQNKAESGPRPNSDSVNHPGSGIKSTKKGRSQRTSGSITPTIHEDENTPYNPPLSNVSVMPTSDITDVAMPPSIPRVPTSSTIHNRKRSASQPLYPGPMRTSAMNPAQKAPLHLNPTPTSGLTANVSGNHSTIGGMFSGTGFNRKSNNVSGKSSTKNADIASERKGGTVNPANGDEGDDSDEEEAKNAVSKVFAGRRRGRRNSTTATSSTIASRAKEITTNTKPNKLSKQKYSSKSDNEASGSNRESAQRASAKQGREQIISRELKLDREHSPSSSRMSEVSAEFGLNANFFDAGRVDPFDVNSAGVNPGTSDYMFNKSVGTNVMKTGMNGMQANGSSRFRASSMTSQNYVPQNPSGTGLAAAAATASYLSSRQGVSPPSHELEDGSYEQQPPTRVPPPPPPTSQALATTGEHTHRKGEPSNDSVAPPDIFRERRKDPLRPGSSKELQADSFNETKPLPMEKDKEKGGRTKGFSLFGRKDKKERTWIKGDPEADPGRTAHVEDDEFAYEEEATNNVEKSPTSLKDKGKERAKEIDLDVNVPNGSLMEELTY